MSYELFKQSAFSECADDDPLAEALLTCEIERVAIGMVPLSEAGLGAETIEALPVKVNLAYNKDRDMPEEYVVTIQPTRGNVNERYYKTRHTADAVFEKLVRDYELTENANPSQYEAMQEEYEDMLEEETEDESDETSSVFWS